MKTRWAACKSSRAVRRASLVVVSLLGSAALLSGGGLTGVLPNGSSTGSAQADAVSDTEAVIIELTAPIECKVIGGYDFVNGDADPADDAGHGTHVAAIAAGNGALNGVAPEAQILAYKVLDQNGIGTTSDVIAAIERATDPDGDSDPSDHATVINLSLSHPGTEDDPDSIAVDNASALGVLSVVAAGDGSGFFTIGAPGSARTALTVGATDDADQVASFSSGGPTAVERLIKPEIMAPGVDICAARWSGDLSGTACLDTSHAEHSGTSMAAPHVAGAAALLRGLRPSLTPAVTKAILQEAAVLLPGLSVTRVGAGRLDVRAAGDVETAITPAPLNFGVDSDASGTWVRTVVLTIHNLGSAAKTYTLRTADPLPAGITGSVTPNPSRSHLGPPQMLRCRWWWTTS